MSGSIADQQYSHEWNLVLTGFSLGLLHVLAGPDHLSALAALAVGTSYKAFLLGVRWGFGHSTGLIVVAIIFILLKGDLDLRTLGRYCDSLVGAFMISLGIFGIVTALRTYRDKRRKRDEDCTSSKSQRIQPEEKKLLSLESGSPSSCASSTSNPYSDSGTSSASPRFPNKLLRDEDPPNINEDSAESANDHTSFSLWNLFALPGSHDNDHLNIEECQSCLFIDMHDPTTQRILSFCVGLLHGIAGPGGILGVLPAVEMRKWSSSFLYLGSFIFASTLSMGTFAALYGESTRRLAATAETIELGLNLFSSAMSVIVGAIWLILSILGKLEDLFH